MSRTIQNVLLGVLIGVVLAVSLPAGANHEGSHLDARRLTLTNPNDGDAVDLFTESDDLHVKGLGGSVLFDGDLRAKALFLRDVKSSEEVRVFRRGRNLMAKVPGRRAVVVARLK